VRERLGLGVQVGVGAAQGVEPLERPVRLVAERADELPRLLGLRAQRLGTRYGADYLWVRRDAVERRRAALRTLRQTPAGRR
jgi:hypothetical protein